MWKLIESIVFDFAYFQPFFLLSIFLDFFLL
nr:MAG TPA: hypothetical protein [Caudoviricetes sp.]DAS71737.1 MAG TPA: hypothetical protein [Caudoviricetes sp.]